MKDSRIGESLWSVWEGEGLPITLSEAEVIYYTHEHVDIENEVVRRALASSIQRDGISLSLGQSFRMIEQSVVTLGASTTFPSARIPTYCYENGETLYGDMVEPEELVPTTFVEVPYVD
jgi:hypothetical protein